MTVSGRIRWMSPTSATPSSRPRRMSAHFLAEIRNRELMLERRKQSPSEAGPVELWQGQLAALERSLSMARQNFSEATDFLQGRAGGHHLARTAQPCTILLALIADE
jgi:ATP-dependent helicase HepA